MTRPLGQTMPGGLVRSAPAARAACRVLVSLAAAPLLLASSAIAGAQAIRGTIKARESEAPVPGARVTVTDTANAVLAEVVSGPDGKFLISFKANGRFVVGVRKIGWTPSFSDLISATATDTMLVDFLVPAEPTALATAEVSATAPTTFNSRAIADAQRKGWKVYSPEIVERYRDVAGTFIDMMREAGATGLNFARGDCVRSVRYNRCLVYVLDGQPSGTNIYIHPRDVYFFAVLTASESASQWGSKAPWGAIVVYTRMYGDKRKP